MSDSINVLANEIERLSREKQVIYQSLQIALTGLDAHVSSATQKHQHARSDTIYLVTEQSPRLASWRRDLKLLGQVSAKAAFAQCLYARPAVEAEAKVTLQSFVKGPGVENAVVTAQSYIHDREEHLHVISQTVGDVSAMYEDLLRATVRTSPQDNRVKTADDIDRALVITRDLLDKLKADNERVAALSVISQQSVAKASRMALLHTQDYLPRLQTAAQELQTLCIETNKQRHNTAIAALQHMQQLSQIESRLSTAFAAIKALDMTAEQQTALAHINLVARLPQVYGSWLIEMRRRKDHETSMSSPQGIADEQQRRSLWVNSIDDVLSPQLVNDPTVTSAVDWTRDDIEEYIQLLGRLCYSADITDILTREASALQDTAKPRIVRRGTFKNGSVHEAAFADLSLSTQPAENLDSTRTAITRLTDQLRSEKSRVRRLEDLLYRQSSTVQSSATDGFRPSLDLVATPLSPQLTPQTPPTPLTSFRMSRDLSGPLTDRPRRPSSRHQSDEKSLIRRLVLLEGELDVTKQKLADTDKQVSEDRHAHEIDQSLLREAQSTKKDIMQNMEAQMREFASVRRNLEEEGRGLRSRAEELEDELDRLLGSRELETRNRDVDVQEKDTRINELVDQIERLEASQAERATAQQQYQKTSMAEKTSLKTQNESLHSKVNALSDTLKSRDMAQEEFAIKLYGAVQTLEPQTDLEKGDMASLLAALDNLANRTVAHKTELSEALQAAKTANADTLRGHDDTKARLKQADFDHSEVKMQLQRAQIDLPGLRATLQQAQDDKIDLDAQYQRVRDDREKLLSGNETLQAKFGHAKGDLERTSEELADARQDVKSLEGRLKIQGSDAQEYKRQAAEARTEADDLRARLDAAHHTFERADISQPGPTQSITRSADGDRIGSQRLHTLQTRLVRLLEGLGFAVSFREEEMQIERASKVGASTFSLNEGLQRTSTAASLSDSRKPSQSDLPGTASMSALPTIDSISGVNTEAIPTETPVNSTSNNDESSSMKAFSIDVFSDAITKRIRDYECTARKYQKDSKSAREKSSQSKRDAAHKIAIAGFKAGDLALFLPTRGNKAIGAWAAFNIGSPHHFLAEKDGMSLERREWFVARIARIEERVAGPMSATETARGQVKGDGDNPFNLSPGLTWYLVHATEEKVNAGTATAVGTGAEIEKQLDASRLTTKRRSRPGSIGDQMTNAEIGNQIQIQSDTVLSSECASDHRRVESATFDKPSQGDRLIRNERGASRPTSLISSTRASISQTLPPSQPSTSKAHAALHSTADPPVPTSQSHSKPSILIRPTTRAPTVAATNLDAIGNSTLDLAGNSIRIDRPLTMYPQSAVSRSLSKSLEARRASESRFETRAGFLTSPKSVKSAVDKRVDNGTGIRRDKGKGTLYASLDAAFEDASLQTSGRKEDPVADEDGDAIEGVTGSMSDFSLGSPVVKAVSPPTAHTPATFIKPHDKSQSASSAETQSNQKPKAAQAIQKNTSAQASQDRSTVHATQENSKTSSMQPTQPTQAGNAMKAKSTSQAYQARAPSSSTRVQEHRQTIENPKPTPRANDATSKAKAGSKRAWQSLWSLDYSG